VELKTILARQPGPEVAEQLSIYQACALGCPAVWSGVGRNTRHGGGGCAAVGGGLCCCGQAAAAASSKRTC
jgi:hypothetical protein